MKSDTKVDLEELKEQLARSKANNFDRRAGCALVNVLSKESYAEEHIPGSINIPKDELHEFENRFDKEKEIILYCASSSCAAAPNAVQALLQRGFEKVKHFPGGMKEWRDAGYSVDSGIFPVE